MPASHAWVGHFKALILGLLSLVLVWMPVSLQAVDSQSLPSLGHASTYSISLHEEKHLGQAWMRQFRASQSMYEDPLVQLYAENLLSQLAAHERHLEQRDLSLLLVDRPQLNAFAVPGGIVGIHTGLFVFAPNEDEFASVLAHELAHLSQRHFARRVEAARGAQWATLAGLLAGILVASQGHADAGVAAIASTQAASIQQQLAWSRSYEQEADRIGMETLVAAGFPADAMPRMFEQMQRLANASGRMPEFLLTHPLTENRVADAWSRADQLSAAQGPQPGRDYPLIRARVLRHQLGDTGEVRAWLQRSQLDASVQTYLEAIAASEQGDSEAASETLQRLIDAQPEWLLPRYLQAEMLVEAEAWQAARQALDDLLLYAPSYAPGLFLLAQWHWDQQQWDEARQIYQRLSQQRPEDPQVWYHLAEAAGKAGRHVQLHTARAEFFQLTGRFRAAFTQLDLAQSQAEAENQPWSVQAGLRERRKTLETLQAQMDF